MAHKSVWSLLRKGRRRLPIRFWVGVRRKRRRVEAGKKREVKGGAK